jgi:predicted metalloendopeptidase
MVDDIRINSPGSQPRINNRLTMGEDVGDLGGLILGWMA